MTITGLIENAILRLLAESGGTALLQRNELAALVGCYPSQINYVLTNRFTKEMGFIIESRRGGGGYIKITRIELPGKDIMQVVNAIGGNITQRDIDCFLSNCEFGKFISPRDAALIRAATSDIALSQVKDKNKVRANIFKHMLMHCITRE